MKNKLIVNYWNHSKKLKKHKNKSIDTVISKDNVYNGDNEYRYNVDINNFILNLNNERHNLSLYDLKSKNIYMNRKIDKEGLNIEVDIMSKYKIEKINFYWSADNGMFAGIEQLNIIYPDKTYRVGLKRDELKEISIRLLEDYNTLDIDIKNVNSEKNYRVTSSNLIETINYIFITKQDLNNGELDLTKFSDFDGIALGDLNVNSFKIKKEDINNLKYVDLYEYFFIENIKVVDSSEMKLNPEKIIPFNSELKINGKFIMDLKKNILIYVDSKNNLKVFDKKEILKDKKIERVDFIEKIENYIIIYKGINKYKLFIDDKEYNLTKLFMYYFKNILYKYHYKIEDTNKELMYEELVNILTKHLSIKDIIDICESYLVFKDNLKKLFQKGFTYEYFIYLHERDLDAVIFEMCKDSFDLSKFNDFEIESLNMLGRTYVKRLKK